MKLDVALKLVCAVCLVIITVLMVTPLVVDYHMKHLSEAERYEIIHAEEIKRSTEELYRKLDRMNPKETPR